MTDPDKMDKLNEYQKLLCEVEPQAINDDAEHQRALAAVDRLMRLHAVEPSPALALMIDLLASLIQAYEQRLLLELDADGWDEFADKPTE